MQYETKKRSIVKAISYRTWGTITTAIIVFIFTGEFALALTVGFLEVFSKMGLYFFHERLWQKVGWGKKEVPSFVLWFTGLPASGKKELGGRIFQELKRQKLKVERIDSNDIRPLFPEVGFSPEEVNRHVKRAGHLCAMLEKNGIIVVASFVSPYEKSRYAARNLCQNFIEVYLRSTVENCEKRDAKGHYAMARRGEYRYFPGVDVAYEEPGTAEIVIDVDRLAPEEATRKIVEYLRRNVLTGKNQCTDLGQVKAVERVSKV